MSEDFLVEVRVVDDARLGAGPRPLTGHEAVNDISSAITDMARRIRSRVQSEFTDDKTVWRLGSLEVSFDLDLGSDGSVIVVRDKDHRVVSVKCVYTAPAKD